MAGRSNSGHNPVTLLLLSAGAVLLLAGMISLLPAISSATVIAVEGAPSDFGEAAPPLRPTVTPPPFASQLTPEAVPVLLPDDSAAAIDTPVLQPTPVITIGQKPTRIVIPAIKLDAPVETTSWHTINGVSQWDVPDHFAAGWLMTSALLGQPGNTAITGHHNIEGEVFRNLVKLQPGDRITLYAGAQPFEYEVAARHILPERGQPDEVRRANARWIQPTEDERITLITCWPYTSNTHRLVIVARPIALEKSNNPIEP